MGTLDSETGNGVSSRSGERPGAGREAPATILRVALRAQRGDVLLASVLVTVHQVLEVLVPVTIGVIIDQAIAPGDAGAAVRWLLVLAGQFVILSASGCTAVFVDERARRAATHLARTRLAGRVLDAGGGVERALPGEIVSLSTVETGRIGDGVGAAIVGVGAVTGVLAGAAILLATSFWLGAVVVVGLPVVLLIVQSVAEPLVARADEHQQAVGAASGVAADLLRGLRVVKGLGADAAAAARYRSASREAQQAGFEANRVRSTYAGFTLSIAGGFVILVAWLGARQALDGHMTVGELVAALGVTQFLVGPLGRLAYAGSELAQARASSEHLDAALQAAPAVVGGSLVLPAPASGGSGLELRLDGVRHKGLQGVSFEVGPQEMVAVACSHAEAAALVEILDRSVEPDGGTVTVGGVEHGELTLDEARRIVTVAHHDGPLFGGSLLDNVTAAAPTLRPIATAPPDPPVAPDGPGTPGVAAGPAAPGVAVLEPVLAAASLDDVLAAVDGGLDGALSDEGRSLSGGQRQRVALARALAADAPVLVLHEPTTAVDTATEQRIAHGVRSVRAGRATVVLTASPPLLAVADRVVLIAEGRVVAEGTHAELAAADERYRQVVLR